MSVGRGANTLLQNESTVSMETSETTKKPCVPPPIQGAKRAAQIYFVGAILGQHRTIPALWLKHRSGSCGTASALPKCSIRQSSIICAFGLASAAPRSPYRHLELCGVALIKIVSPSYLPTFSLRPDFALFFCPFAQEKDSHSMEKALLSFRQQGNFYNVLFPDLCRITGGSNAVRCSS